MKNFICYRRNLFDFKNLNNGIKGFSFYKFNKNSLYNKKEDVEEFENRNRVAVDKLKDFEKHLQQFMEQEKSNPNKKEQKPIRITYMNKTNKKSNKEIFIDPVTGNATSGDKIQNNNLNNLDLSNQNKIVRLAGLDEKFPIENFVDLKSIQKRKSIHLQTYKYPAQGEIKGVVYLLHGIFEHSNSNAVIAKVLSENGYEVLSFDYRGHGKSEGVRGYFENKDILVQDINNFINLTENEYKDKTNNKFILGYSLGGLLATLVTMSRPNYFSGLIQIAPALHLDNTKYTFWVKVGRFINMVWPTLAAIKINEIPKNKDVIEYLMNDPYMYKGKLRIGTGFALLDGVKYALENVNKLQTPCYILHGRDDEIVPHSASTQFFNKIPIQDKTILMHDELDHFISRNQNIKFFATDIAFWMHVHAK